MAAVKRFVITMMEFGSKLYFAGDGSPFWKKGTTTLNHAVKFPYREKAEEFATNLPSQHPFKLGTIEEITI